jgi:excisionase family DNA binding protein
MAPSEAAPKFLTAGAVAHMLHVSPKTIARWSNEKKLPFVRTIGGHRRYDPAKVAALIAGLDHSDTIDGGGAA